MADTLRLEIITPQATVFSEDVHMVTLPAVDGQIGVYPHHLRLITEIEPGEIIEGKHDDLPEAAFYMVGPIEMAVAKAEKTAAAAA